MEAPQSWLIRAKCQFIKAVSKYVNRKTIRTIVGSDFVRLAIAFGELVLTLTLTLRSF
jgi:hypothetical protein